MSIHETKVRALRVRRSEAAHANADLKERIGLLRLELRRMLEHYGKVRG